MAPSLNCAVIIKQVDEKTRSKTSINDLFARLMNKIDFDYVALTQALVKCPSVTPYDEGALQIVEEHLNNLGFNCTRLPLVKTDLMI